MQMIRTTENQLTFSTLITIYNFQLLKSFSVNALISFYTVFLHSLLSHKVKNLNQRAIENSVNVSLFQGISFGVSKRSFCKLCIL